MASSANEQIETAAHTNTAETIKAMFMSTSGSDDAL